MDHVPSLSLETVARILGSAARSSSLRNQTVYAWKPVSRAIYHGLEQDLTSVLVVRSWNSLLELRSIIANRVCKPLMTEVLILHFEDEGDMSVLEAVLLNLPLLHSIWVTAGMLNKIMMSSVAPSEVCVYSTEPFFPEPGLALQPRITRLILDLLPLTRPITDLLMVTPQLAQLAMVVRPCYLTEINGQVSPNDDVMLTFRNVCVECRQAGLRELFLILLGKSSLSQNVDCTIRQQHFGIIVHASVFILGSDLSSPTALWEAKGRGLFNPWSR